MSETTNVSFSFPVPNPQNITISAGDSVRFNGPSSFHPLQQVTDVNSDTPQSGGFAATTSPFVVEFNNPGVYYYRCTNHGVFALNGTMRGSITVTAAINPTPTRTAEPTKNPDETPSVTPTKNGDPGGCTTKPSIVTITSPIQAEKISSAKATLKWEKDTCATSYRVVVHKKKRNGVVVDQKTTSKTSYKTVKLDAKTTFFWGVKACNSKGCSSAANSSFMRN